MEYLHVLSGLSNVDFYSFDATADDRDGRRTADAARGGFVDLEQDRAEVRWGIFSAGHAPGAEVLVEANGAQDGAGVAQNAQVLNCRGVCVGDGAALLSC